ncbi:MAG TPA: S9 family peptidase [Gemmatimonadaceae bacterium]|jgi:dipeptidyl aminopeptidase/acylaminoacyl peptidase
MNNRIEEDSTMLRVHKVTTTAALALISLAGLAMAQGAAAQSAKRPMTIDDMMALKNVGGVAISPNGSLVVHTVSGWEHPAANPAKGDTALGDKHEVRSHLWLVPADGSRPPRQITFSERGESQPQWSPDGSAIAFLSARGAAAGDEQPRPEIHLLRLDGGEAEKITNAKDGVTGFSWSPDGKRIAFLSVDSLTKTTDAARKRKDDAQVYEGDFRLSHVWVVDVATKKENELLHTTEFTVRGAPTWSPDSRRIAYVTTPSTLLRDERRNAFIVDATTGQAERIDAGAAVQGTPAWSPDGRTLALETLRQTHPMVPDSMQFREILDSHLELYDVATKRSRDMSAGFDNSPGAMTWSADSKSLYFTAGDHVYSSVFRFDVASSKYSQLTQREIVRGVSFDKSGAHVAFVMDSPISPGNVYASDATFASARKLTDANPQLVNFALGESEVVTWKSSDGQQVEGVLLKPVGYRAGQRYPLLVDIHGGPTGAHNIGFKANWGSPGQFWAGQGWAVLYPNPRGSTGYGEKFMRGNVPDWGGGDYRDIMAGVDAMVARGVADNDKLAVSGWSYGGYMTSWVVTQTNRFKAAMEGAGLTDLVSMYGTTDIPGYIASFFNGVPNKQTMEFYRQRSAITFVDNVTTPLLILHGGNDQRVPIGQPMEYFRQLKDRGKTVQLVFFPREGHGFSEYYHQMDKVRREFDWINRYTLGAPKSVSSR